MKNFSLLGWALIVSALISLFGWLWFNILGQASTVILTVLFLIGSILLIAGLPAIQAMQPQTGTLGQIGLALIGIGAAIAIVVNVLVQLSGVTVGEALPFASALIGMAGAIILGVVTIRTGVFPVWVGWLLIAGGIANFLGGLISPSMGAQILGAIGILAEAAALLGYGITVVQQQRALPERGAANRY
jgi:hypothetical protein